MPITPLSRRLLTAVLAPLCVAGCTVAALPAPAANLEPLRGSEPAAVAGAADQPVLRPLHQWSVTLVTARAVPRLGEVRDITQAFTFEGRVYAHATFTAPPGSLAGPTPVEARWRNGGRLVSVQRAQLDVTRTPYYMVSSTSGTALGAGRCQVEFVANGQVVAVQAFDVTER